uniref:PstS family phosphate ABC transporter substrate-binding protein n=1 Tax=uncultured Sphingomonas sp. TaxID=158754 RepID=UPI0035C9B435
MIRPLLLAALACIAMPAAADPAPDLPPSYVPHAKVSGTITIAGHGAYGKRADFIEALTGKWEDGFRRYQPGVTFKTDLKGTAAAMGGLYTGTADLALMGREIWAPEIAAFREVKGYAPTGIDVLTGSFATRNRGYAITIFVHKDNPVRAISLTQLDALYSQTRRRGGKAVATWGDLGATGAWATRPVHLYGLPIARGFAEYMQERVFLGGSRWNPAIREFADAPGTTGEADGGAAMVKAMADDPDAIGYAGALYSDPGVKLIAVSEGAKPAVFPTERHVMDRSYPLARIITIFLDKQPGKPADPKLTEFLRYVLSREGQQAVLSDGGGYLPILAPEAARQIAKLEKSR